VCSLPLVGSGGGPFLSSCCCVASLLHGIVNVQLWPVIVVCWWVVLMTMNDIIHHLIAMLLATVWHLPGTHSLAGAGDVALQGCSCHVKVCCGGRGSSRTIVHGGGDW